MDGGGVMGLGLAILFGLNAAGAGWNGWTIYTGHGTPLAAIALALNIGAMLFMLAGAVSR